MRVINIGCYPPPYGGISVHLKRLEEYLEKENINHVIIDLSKCYSAEKANNEIMFISWRKAIVYLFFHKKAILHFHDFSWKNTFIYYLLGFKHFTIVSLHNERFPAEIEKAPRILRKSIAESINAMNYFIVDSSKCCALAKKIVKDKSKIFVIPEFIPPSAIPRLNEQSLIVEMRKKHKFLISSNAWQICFHNGVDLYGIDMLIELTVSLNKEDIDAAFCLLLPGIGNNNYFLKLKEKIKKFHLEDKFVFITDPLEEASSLWRISDIVIRATNTDGDSLTVCEALSVGTPVIASDCVPRPKGVVLFRTRDFNDLYRKTRTVLSNVEEFKTKTKNLNIENNAHKIIDLYKSVIETENK